ncbi:E3 ubiquitin-protein ligase rad18 [Coemansia guatemalensis]|uniref:Postreplication repair E3 ubiquitin-protein ligase RAD18 n=1 Tax=Coemansia guatemalensis TaxID=2761395 RepID=A0A9W8HRY2_9FUNG|nr:E3 ubiquitin-protein ligase rad18 [Coemansia guatemalensis]
MVSSSCGHTFCSLCVRRCLTLETICPSCRAPLTESELYPNRLIDSILRSFKSGRQQLLDALTKPLPRTTSLGEKTHCATCSKRGLGEDRRSGPFHGAAEQRKRLRMNTRSTTRAMECQSSSSDMPASCGVELTASEIDEVGSSDLDISQAMVEDDSDFMPERNDSGIDSGQNSRQRPKKTLLRGASAASNDSVACPNCHQDVRQSRINWHLDRCLAGKLSPEPRTESGISQAETINASSNKPNARNISLRLQSQPSKFTLPRPTKLVYSLLSESKLRRILKELGLPTKGDKYQMKARHVEWVNMYMANADAENPVSHKILLKRLAEWEESLAKPADAAAKTQTAATPDSWAEYEAKHADDFAALIAQASASQKRASARTDITVGVSASQGERQTG